jgi:ubiquinone/menaquinone biosynthesis C-methylase UbiE
MFTEFIEIHCNHVFPNQKPLENGHIQIVNRNKQVTILNPNSAPNTIYGLAQQMPFKSDSFDKIIGLASVPAYLPNNINEYRETFNELLRILKPGGECILNPVIENIYNSPLFQKLLDDLKTKTKINFSEPYTIQVFRDGKETKFNCLKMQMLKL